jgi:DNA-binding XRE family transcriptional regulator
MLNLLDDDYTKLKIRFSAMLMMLRNEKGLTIKQVAYGIGVTPKAV